MFQPADVSAMLSLIPSLGDKPAAWKYLDFRERMGSRDKAEAMFRKCQHRTMHNNPGDTLKEEDTAVSTMFSQILHLHTYLRNDSLHKE